MLEQINLYRVCTSEKGTFGVLLKDNVPLCVTCEDPDKHNKKNVSCIPTGVYNCVSYFSEKYDKVWKVLDVPNRSDILIHIGNTIKDTSGCILVGERFGELNGIPAILNSSRALNKLRDILPNEFLLTIKGG